MALNGVSAAVIGYMATADFLAIAIILLLFAIFWTAIRIIRKEKELAKNIRKARPTKKGRK